MNHNVLRLVRPISLEDPNLTSDSDDQDTDLEPPCSDSDTEPELVLDAADLARWRRTRRRSSGRSRAARGGHGSLSGGGLLSGGLGGGGSMALGAVLAATGKANLAAPLTPYHAKMELCSCFSGISCSQRGRDVKAWLDGRPWHTNASSRSSEDGDPDELDPLPPDQEQQQQEYQQRRCKDGCPGCVVALVRSACHSLLALEGDLPQLLSHVSTTLLPELCRRSRAGELAEDEAFSRLLKLLQACSEPLESRANMTCVVVNRLRNCLMALLAVAESADSDLAMELRTLLANLNASDSLSPKVIQEQRMLLRALMENIWDVWTRHGDSAMDFGYML